MIKPLFKNVVVAVNGSESSVHACMYGIMLAKQLNVKLKAVFVVDTEALRKLTLTRFFVAEESEDYKVKIIADGENCLHYVSDLAKQKGIKLETELRQGSIWSEIVTASEDFGADIVLVGGNSESSFGSKLKKSISSSGNEIIANSRCSVLVVKNQEIERLFKLI